MFQNLRKPRDFSRFAGVVSRYVCFVKLTMCLAFFTQAAQADWQPFTLENGHIIIDVEISGQAGRAMLDRGTSINVIRRDLVEKFGHDFKKFGMTEVNGVDGTRREQVYGGIPVTLLDTDILLNGVVAGDIDNVELILGGGYFSNAIIQIDYPNLRFRRLSKKSVDLKEHANVPMKNARGSRLPAIQVEVNGVKVWLILDTGNSSGILVKRKFATESGWLTDETVVTKQTGSGVFESETTLNFYMDSLKIGPYGLENVAVHVPEEDHVNDFGRYVAGSKAGTRIKSGAQAKGLIGYDVLKHFVVTIDYSSNRAHLYLPK